MAYLLDTNILIYARDGADVVTDRMAGQPGALFLSALSLAELHRGFAKQPAYAAIRKPRLDAILRQIPVLPFDTAAAEAYGAIILRHGWLKGRDFDRMIAGHALSTASILVTNNEADFRDITGLTIENWAV